MKNNNELLCLTLQVTCLLHLYYLAYERHWEAQTFTNLTATELSLQHLKKHNTYS